MKTHLRIGTRGSLLALTQAKEVKKALEAKNRNISFKLIIVKTEGDAAKPLTLFGKGSTGIFTKAIEKSLIENKIDIAVHSLKDLPTETPSKLCLAAFPKRVGVEDVLLSRKKYSLNTLPYGSLVGTGSPRRKRQLFRLRPDLRLVDVQGNLDTRAKSVLIEKKYDAVVVARAGLERIKKYKRFAHIIPVEKLLPAVGQAALAIEIRANDESVMKAVRKLNHTATEQCVLAERHFLKILEGGCRVPVGAHSFVKKSVVYLRAAVFSPDTADFVSGEIFGKAADYKIFTEKLAKDLLKKGAKRFLQKARMV